MADQPDNGKDASGRFLPGNRFWEARSTHGRKPIFESPNDLADACTQYFEWVENNPLQEEKVFNGKDGIVRANVSKMRAMTIDGMCIFLDISRKTWDLYRERADYIPVVTRAEEIIRSQKFAGAAADLLNANIIARDLGLSDKSESAVTIKDERSPDEIAEGIESKLVGIAAQGDKG